MHYPLPSASADGMDMRLYWLKFIRDDIRSFRPIRWFRR